MHVLDKYGWPIERVNGRWIQYLIRCLIHGRRWRRGKWNERRNVALDWERGFQDGLAERRKKKA